MRSDLKKLWMDLRMWASLHVLIGVGVPAILIFFFGCNELKEEPPPIGAEVDASQVSDALTKALEGSSVYSVYKNQQVVFELTQKIETNPPSPYLYIKQDVTKIDDTPQYFSYTYNEITEDPNSEPGTKPIVKEVTSDLYQPRPTVTTTSLSELAIQELDRLQLFSEKQIETMSEERTPVRTTFHDLFVSREVQSPPLVVQERPHCSEVPNCQLHVTKIQFDQILWYAEGDYSKVRYNLEIAPEAPFLSRILSDCVATSVPYQGRRYYVKNCKNVLDFWYGTPPTE
ncbi:MAG: hypothetical protein KDD34_06280 [Bdellovibrionales bacterium]|nr:hypothetical protein [Bdellovibrionales bacterium]